ncbi:Anaphase-promoting complex subunit 10, partial [Linum grandiflorum]
SPTSLWRNFKTASASFVRSSVEIELGNGKRVSFELTAARVSDQSQSFMATESSEGEEEGKITGGSQHLTVEDDLRELGKKAAWSVSSCKTGNGVSSLRDDNLDTYWQSDGAQPHLVNIQFQKKVKLQDIKTVELVKPTGWVYISLSGNDPRETFVNTFMLQIAVLSNHLNGRDTHIRQIKVYGPRPNPIPHQPFQFTSTEFITYSSVR